ncbi:hypothetical protein H7J88_01385 [Mycolicibacterium flavescens]|uniref:Uncharacterized protein n=1 Tax=Mycolicibacterium flavescens TaxID=1776 RepID=A0A1E3RQ61_MYCFV|nr:hypothetical protein [Mycolicibacterium flavescens]MCV7278296.1 hypothetical protein [Mycolicibacterium flavescens]ODQ91547.1 hypothetical protein BHQ18_05550 [Mycolicibacterium flavescens]
MKKLATTVGTIMAATALGLGTAATAVAAPSGVSSADQTLTELRADGYNVIVSRTGTGTIDKCSVTDVRPGQTYSRTDSGVPGHILGTPGPNIATTVMNKTAHVTLAC